MPLKCRSFLNSPFKKRTPLRLMSQVDIMLSTKETYHPNL